MIDPLQAATKLSSFGLQAQSTRLRVVAENIANANSTGNVAGADPYSRKTVTFKNVLDDTIKAQSVVVDSIGKDDSEFPVEFSPGHPAADDKGMVKKPNVNVLVEMADMREGNRIYEANLQMMKYSRTMKSSLIDLLRT